MSFSDYDMRRDRHYAELCRELDENNEILELPKHHMETRTVNDKKTKASGPSHDAKHTELGRENAMPKLAMSEIETYKVIPMKNKAAFPDDNISRDRHYAELCKELGLYNPNLELPIREMESCRVILKKKEAGGPCVDAQKMELDGDNAMLDLVIRQMSSFPVIKQKKKKSSRPRRNTCKLKIEALENEERILDAENQRMLDAIAMLLLAVHDNENIDLVGDTIDIYKLLDGTDDAADNDNEA